MSAPPVVDRASRKLAAHRKKPSEPTGSKPKSVHSNQHNHRHLHPSSSEPAVAAAALLAAPLPAPLAAPQRQPAERTTSKPASKLVRQHFGGPNLTLSKKERDKREAQLEDEIEERVAQQLVLGRIEKLDKEISSYKNEFPRRLGCCRRKTHKHVLIPSVAPDFRTWFLPSAKGLPPPTSPPTSPSCCKRFLQELDQPHENGAIPAYNPAQTQDITCCRTWTGMPTFLCGSVYLCTCPWRTRKHGRDTLWPTICRDRVCCCDDQVEESPPKCCCTRYCKMVPCSQKVPTPPSPHLARDRCPTFTYVFLVWRIMLIILTFTWNQNPKNICERKFVVKPSYSLIAVMDDDAPFTQGLRMGYSSLYQYSTEYPEAFDTQPPCLGPGICDLPEGTNFSWVNHTTFVYADEVLPELREIYSPWFNFQDINPWDFTYRPQSSLSFVSTLNRVSSPLYLLFAGMAANAYSNRWCGWGVVFWIISLFQSFGELGEHLRDLQFCKESCQNVRGEPFSANNMPEFTKVAVYQNGTCDNWYQKQHYETVVGTTAYRVANAGQPYKGCFMWRQVLQVPTVDLKVIDYASIATGWWGSIESGTGALQHRINDLSTVASCVNQTVVPQVSGVAAACALKSSGELTKDVQECVLREGGGEFEQAQLTVVNECMELELVRHMLPLDVVNASATSSVIDSSEVTVNGVRQKLTPFAKENADACAQNLGMCLLQSSPEQCAAKCASNAVFREATDNFDFDQKALMACVVKRLSANVVDQAKNALLTCTDFNKGGSSEDRAKIQRMQKKATTCFLGTLMTLIQKCFHGGASSEDSLDVELVSSGVKKLLHDFAQAVSESPVKKLHGIVQVAKKQASLEAKKIPFSEAAQNHQRRCEAMLAGNSPSFAFDQSYAISQSITLCLLALAVCVMLIFIAVDGIYSAVTRSRGLRSRLCDFLRRHFELAFGHCRWCAVCDGISSRCNRCLYFLRIRTIKPVAQPRSRPRAGTSMADLEREDEEENGSGNNDNASPKSGPAPQMPRRRVKRYCRAMPPLVVSAIIVTSIVLFWWFMKMLSLSSAWSRWGMFIANTVVKIPSTVNLVEIQREAGNASTAADIFLLYGNPVPDDMPPICQTVVNSVVQWFLDSGRISGANDALNGDDPLWNIVFHVVYWIIVYSIVCTFVSTVAPLFFFVFRTRHLWQRIAATSRAQKRLIRKYFDPVKGWDKFPPELEAVLNMAKAKAPIPSHHRYQFIQLAAPFPALFFWMNIGAVWAQYITLMFVLLMPVALIVGLTLYNIAVAVANDGTPLDGLKTTSTFFTTVVLLQLINISLLIWSRYWYRSLLYDRYKGIVHPYFEATYTYYTLLTYTILGMYHVYVRLGYSIVSTAGRLGVPDVDLVGFGQDYLYNSYLGLLESVRLKNEYEAKCLHATKGTDLDPRRGNENETATLLDLKSSIDNLVLGAEEMANRVVEMRTTSSSSTTEEETKSSFK
jgi:hypothetical protein